MRCPLKTPYRDSTQSALAIHAKLRPKLGDRVRFRRFHGHNDVSDMMSLNTTDDEVGRAVLDFIAETAEHSHA